VCRVGAGTCRDVPAVGVVGIDGDRPRVVAVAALVGRLPGLAGVGAERGPPPPASYARPRARGCQASECTSLCAPGRWSCQLCPPSLERIRPPSSIPTRSMSASCGLGAIQRTCDVHGRGGKLQCGREGSSRSAFNSRQLSPLSPLRNSRLGSVPAYTAPSAALTASENTARSGSSQSIQLRPPSTLRRTPPSRRPTKTVSGSAASTARHCAPLPGKESSTVHASPASSSRAKPSPVAE
jgi:hypothetical protein